jgi:phosphate starvation-inducible PhoH-like protein
LSSGPNQAVIPLNGQQEALALFGEQDVLLRQIRQLSSARISARGDVIVINGEAAEVERTKRLLTELIGTVRKGGDVQEAIERGDTPPGGPAGLPNRLRAKTPGQQSYLEAIERSDITFGIGPAGTGKTYLAVAMAIAHLRSRRVKRIILTRPAVEAGERLGFLPGDLQAKIDPYLRPLYDALYDMLESDRFESYLARGTIEVAPLAFMRGRTLNDAFIILDEAQNTTAEQMKMFLTRMGFSSKVVVTGDITQVDLPRHLGSGLIVAEQTLVGIEGIHFHHFSEADVVRHPLVGRIVKAYEVAEALG